MKALLVFLLLAAVACSDDFNYEFDFFVNDTVTQCTDTDTSITFFGNFYDLSPERKLSEETDFYFWFDVLINDVADKIYCRIYPSEANSDSYDHYMSCTSHSNGAKLSVKDEVAFVLDEAGKETELSIGIITGLSQEGAYLTYDLKDCSTGAASYLKVGLLFLALFLF